MEPSKFMCSTQEGLESRVELMSWRVDEAMSWWVDELMSRWVDESMSRCVDESMSRCVDESMSRCVDELMCWCVDVLMLMSWCVDVSMCWENRHTRCTADKQSGRQPLSQVAVATNCMRTRVHKRASRPWQGTCTFLKSYLIYW
jgi:hypothetical protein